MTGSSLNRRWTPYTDTRGQVREDYKSSWCLDALRAGEAAGIPGEYLSPEGWSGRDDDIEGFWAHLIYQWRDAVDSRLTESAVSEAIALRAKVVSGILGDDSQRIRLALAPFTNDARLIRLIATGSGRWEPKMLVAADDLDFFGVPSSPGHYDHGHGKTPHGWTCFE